MKFVRLSFLPALVIVLISFASCDKGNPPEPTVEETQFNMLTATSSWKIDKVSFGAGNTDRTSEYSGMTLDLKKDLSFNQGGTFKYEVKGRPSLSPWPVEGTWKFHATDPETLIIRTEDDLQITYSVTDTALQLSFTYSGAGYTNPRVSAVVGTWVFLFKK